MFFGNEMRNVPAGIVLGPHDPEWPAGIRFGGIPRYLGKRSAAKKWARESLREARQIQAQLGSMPDDRS